MSLTSVTSEMHHDFWSLRGLNKPGNLEKKLLTKIVIFKVRKRWRYVAQDQLRHTQPHEKPYGSRFAFDSFLLEKKLLKRGSWKDLKYQLMHSHACLWNLPGRTPAFLVSRSTAKYSGVGAHEALLSSKFPTHSRTWVGRNKATSQTTGRLLLRAKRKL